MKDMKKEEPKAVERNGKKLAEKEPEALEMNGEELTGVTGGTYSGPCFPSSIKKKED